MLTSKPPFQSSTTDEIYRRAKERDYEWPSEDTKYISKEAKDIVAMMLEDADMRPDPDAIVHHPFFITGHMPSPAEMTSRLRELPPDDERFYHYASTRHEQAQNLQTLKEMCKECGVGPWIDTQLIHKPVWKEVAAEGDAGLTPTIPLPEDMVYRPFDDWLREKHLQSRFAPPQPPSQVESTSQLTLKSDDLTTISHKEPAGLLRAPPQSFAAQQRAQGRPATSTSKVAQGAETAQTTTIRSRARKEVPLTNVLSLESREQPTRGTARTLRGHLTQSRTVTGAERKPEPAARSEPRRVVSRETEAGREDIFSLFGPSEYREKVADSQPDVVLGRLRKLQAELERALNSRSMAIVSTKDKTPTPPQIVVKWVDYTNKFGLGYILNDGSVGCILRTIPSSDGPKPGMLPPACLLIHEAERHIQRKDDPTYADRHQIVPMSEGIYFYENNGEEGLCRARVDPEQFRVPVGDDGVVGKLAAGRDIYDHRKRERVMLWKKFANYMLAYGRELEGNGGHADETPMRKPTITDPTAAPSDVVTFYQRFGDVSCWVFSDGHLQVCIPSSLRFPLVFSWCDCRIYTKPYPSSSTSRTTPKSFSTLQAHSVTSGIFRKTPPSDSPPQASWRKPRSTSAPSSRTRCRHSSTSPCPPKPQQRRPAAAAAMRRVASVVAGRLATRRGRGTDPRSRRRCATCRRPTASGARSSSCAPWCASGWRTAASATATRAASAACAGPAPARPTASPSPPNTSGSPSAPAPATSA